MVCSLMLCRQLHNSFNGDKTCTIKQITILISGSCLSELCKCHGKPLIALPDQSCGPIYRLLRNNLNQGVIPPVLMRGTTVVIISGMNFCNLGVVPSKLPEIRYDGWYRNHICSVRLPTVFRYFEGTTPKTNLFQFL